MASYDVLAAALEIYYDNQVGATPLFGQPFTLNVAAGTNVFQGLGINFGNHNDLPPTPDTILGQLPDGAYLTSVQVEGTVYSDGVAVGTAYLAIGSEPPDTAALVSNGNAVLAIADTPVDPGDLDNASCILVVQTTNATLDYTFEFTTFLVNYEVDTPPPAEAWQDFIRCSEVDSLGGAE